MTQSFLKSTDFSRDEAAALFRLTAELKAQRGKGHIEPLKGQTWAMLFHKSSTRTRISFEVGVYELGGHPMILDPNSLQLGRGESVEDTARVMSRYLHGIIIRTYEQALLDSFDAAGSIPVVNALTNELHPCQIYTDAFTLIERWSEPGKADLSSLAGRQICFVGDCASNMAHSWILASALFGIQLHLTGPKAYGPLPFIGELLKSAGLEPTWQFSDDAKAAVEGSDMVYTDVWVSMGDEDEKEQRLRDFMPYQVNRDLMSVAKPDAYFMHCLPAHEGEEVSAEVLNDPRSIIFDQAENRLHTQKAILAGLADRSLLG